MVGLAVSPGALGGVWGHWVGCVLGPSPWPCSILLCWPDLLVAVEVPPDPGLSSQMKNLDCISKLMYLGIIFPMKYFLVIKKKKKKQR